MSSAQGVVYLPSANAAARSGRRSSVEPALPRAAPPGARHTLADFIDRFVLSDALSLPLDALTRSLVVLGGGEARAHAAAVLVEEMVADRLPIVIFDTRGIWQGLLRSLDGSRPGLPLQVFGEGGGIELRPQAGRLLADCAIALARPSLVDLSGMAGDAAAHFAAEFVEQLRVRDLPAMHLVLDDARLLTVEARAGCVTSLLELTAREGAGRLGLTVVTDSPALLDRRLVGRADALLVGRTAERDDHDAAWLWVDARSDRRTATRIAQSLEHLQSGEAWICGPEWLGINLRVRLRPQATQAALSRRPQAPCQPQSQASRAELRRLQARLGDEGALRAPSPRPASAPCGQEPPRRPWPAPGAEHRERRARAPSAQAAHPRRGRPVADLVLSREERAGLEDYARQGGARAAVAQRARIVLACAEGRLNGDVARSFGVTIQMVGRWRRRFVEQRLQGLLRAEPVPADGVSSDASGRPAAVGMQA